jgi:hypothetical protein
MQYGGRICPSYRPFVTMGSGNAMGDGCMNGMMNGNGPCQNADVQALMAQNADGTWNCLGYQDAQACA